MGTIVLTYKVLANPCKMLMPKATRVQIYEHLFREGVMVAKKDFHLAKHPEVPVPNLHVIKALQSLKSRGLVTEQFAWRQQRRKQMLGQVQTQTSSLERDMDVDAAALRRRSNVITSMLLIKV